MSHRRKLAAALSGLAAVITVAGAGARVALQRSAYSDPAWSPNGRYIAFVDREAGELRIATANGTEVRTLRVGHFPAYPSWSPSGRKLVFQDSAGLELISVDGVGARRRLASGGAAPDWSPRGRRIAYSVALDTGSSPIYVINPNGTHRQLVARVRNGSYSLLSPAWSPDGERLAFCVCRTADSGDVATALGIISSYRGRIRRLLAPFDPLDPDWSPEGARIAFSDNREEVTVFNFHTRRVYKLHGGDHPRWSPNGRQIVYADNGVICMMNANGSNAHLLIGAAGRSTRPCVS